MSEQYIPAIEEPQEPQPGKNVWWEENKVKVIAAGIGLAIVIVLGLVIFLLTRSAAATALVRDIMIIFLAFTSWLIGVMLFVLIYYIAELTKLLRDEIKPLLESANETMDTLRGTTVFMSENVVEPTIKASSTIAGARRIIEVLLDLRPGTRRKP